MIRNLIFVTALIVAMCAPAGAQNTGTIRGTVLLRANNAALHNATVTVLPLRRNVETDLQGRFEVRNVPPGTYDVIAHMHALSDETRRVTVTAGDVAEVSFLLGVASLRQELTVTASGQEETTLDAFQSVISLEGHQLNTRTNAPALGEILESEPGIAKRSFGPGTARPVIRGFDGDRVLVLQDGTRTGTLSSQSGDHGEPVDPSEIERIEVVRGPATLLYGSSAIGGVVNVITRHHELHEHPHEGLRGSVTATGGTTNNLGGVSGNAEYGLGDWLIWGGGGTTRTGDYRAPLVGEIHNSGTRMDQGSTGFGRYSQKGSFTLNYDLEDGRYGVPFAAELGHGHADEQEGHGAEDIDLKWRRQHLRLLGVRRGVGAFENVTGILNYTDWRHRELEGGEVGTRFYNKQFTYQGMFTQKRAGLLSGSFGFWGMERDFKAVGEEALAPPVRQHSIAAFGLEQINFERVRLQFGGRIENNRYRPQELRARSFTGFSGSAGANFSLWHGGAFVANYTSSYRVHALEELYNNGPHVGNLAFETGNPNLQRERGNGVEFSLRHQGGRVRAEANTFYYRFSDYVFLAATNEFEGGLRRAEFLQNDVRYMGAEARFDAVLNSMFTLRLGADAVDARVRNNGPFLPRIPPVRGRVGFDMHTNGLSIRPEVVLSNAQWKTYTGETRTPGFAVLNLGASYTIAKQHLMHVFNANLFNASDRLYRNHLSFIKDLAPEIGRGFRLSYTLHWY